MVLVVVITHSYTEHTAIIAEGVLQDRQTTVLYHRPLQRPFIIVSQSKASLRTETYDEAVSANRDIRSSRFSPIIHPLP